MGKGNEISKRIEEMLDSIRLTTIYARKNISKNINTELLPTYWEIGALIAESTSNSNKKIIKTINFGLKMI